MADNRLFLVDGHALCYRSFYAIRELRSSNGQATNAVYGFISTLKKIFREYEPQYMAVCFDSKEQTLRQQKYAEYKIQRPPMPDELISQIPIIKEVIKAFNISVFECPGYEADDIIATVTKASVSKDLEVIIVSDDKDMFQLAEKNVKFFSPRKSIVLTQADLKETLGFLPERMADFIALAGDNADNIPGVNGIGKVAATNLIVEFGNLQNIFNNVERIEKVKVKEKLIEQKEAAFLSRDLAVLEENVPLKFELSDLKVKEPDRDKLFKLFKQLEFRRLAEEYSGGFHTESKAEISSLTTDNEIKELSKSLSAHEKAAYLIKDEQEGELFSSKKLYISGDGAQVFEIPLEKISLLRDNLNSKKQAKVLYGLKNFLRKTAQYDVEVSYDIFDVMLAGYLLAPAQSGYAPSDLLWKYLKQSLPQENLEAHELKAVFQLHPILTEELERSSLLGLLLDIEMPLARVLFKMEREGVCIDLELLSQLSKECEGRLEKLTVKLYKEAGEEFNINSPKQLSKILFDKLKLPAIKKTKTGLSTNESVLNVLSDLHEVPMLILEYRQIAKLKSTYIDALPRMINEKTGRIHAEFDQTGAETGRLSSRHPNLQNIPIRSELGREIRKAFIPSKGNILMAVDYSQIELRILAHLSKDKGLLAAFQADEDIHAYTASLIFDEDENKVDSHMRDTAKRVNFGIIYGMSAFGLAKDLKITNIQAQEFINRYFLRYPEVKNFMDEQIRLCEERGYVLTLLNRRRYIPEINSKNNAVRQFAQRQAINTPVQGSAADLMKLSMIDMQNKLEKNKFSSKIISTVHDEIVFDVKKEEKDDLIVLAREVMENSMTLSVPIKVSVKIGKNWLDVKEV